MIDKREKILKFCIYHSTVKNGSCRNSEDFLARLTCRSWRQAQESDRRARLTKGTPHQRCAYTSPLYIFYLQLTHVRLFDVVSSFACVFVSLVPVVPANTNA